MGIYYLEHVHISVPTSVFPQPISSVTSDSTLTHASHTDPTADEAHVVTQLWLSREYGVFVLWWKVKRGGGQWQEGGTALREVRGMISPNTLLCRWSRFIPFLIE